MSRSGDTLGLWVGAVALALLVAPMAGCLGSDDDDDESEPPGRNGSTETSPAPPTTLPWGMEGCQVVVAIVPVDAQTLSEHLPEGFEPVSPEDAFGLPDDPRGDGALGLETFRCPAMAGVNGTIEDAAYGALFAPVQPPANVSSPDVNTTFYKWETLVSDDAVRETLLEHGLPAVDGSTDLSGLRTTATGTHVFDVSLTLGEATFTFSGSAGQPNEAFREGFSFAELQSGADGFGLWVCLENSAAGGNSGTGTVQLASGHWTTEVVGQERTQAYMVASTNVTFEQAVIRLP